MSTLKEQIEEVISDEPVAVFIKGTPEMVMCGNSHRALNALSAVGAPVTTVDVLPDPRIRQELSAISGWPTIPQVFVKGELIGGADITEELLESGDLQRKLDEALGAERAPRGQGRRARARPVEQGGASRGSGRAAELLPDRLRPRGCGRRAHARSRGFRSSFAASRVPRTALVPRPRRPSPEQALAR